MIRSTTVFGAAVLLLLASGFYRAGTVQAKDENPDEAAVRAAAARFAAAFNAGKAKELAGEFLPDAELIDDEGNQYQGEKELGALITAYFEKFPDAKLALDVESVRIFSKQLAIEEGT